MRPPVQPPPKMPHEESEEVKNHIPQDDGQSDPRQLSSDEKLDLMGSKVFLTTLERAIEGYQRPADPEVPERAAMVAPARPKTDIDRLFDSFDACKTVEELANLWGTTQLRLGQTPQGVDILEQLGSQIENILLPRLNTRMDMKTFRSLATAGHQDSALSTLKNTQLPPSRTV